MTQVGGFPSADSTFRHSTAGAALLVHVTPKEGPARLRGVRDGVLEVDLSAQNSEQCHHRLVNFFSRLLNIEPRHIEIVAGRGTNKMLIFHNLAPEDLEARLQRLLKDETPARW